MRKIVIIGLTLLLVTTSSFAAYTYPDFFRDDISFNPTSVRIEGMGGAGVSTSTGLDSLYMNPANLAGGEFSLYCQKIMPIKANAEPHEMHEILIRMTEEESNLMPPGAFLPFVEKYKMMSRLDCWVVSHIVQWLSAHKTTSKSVFSINVSRDTIKNTKFPAFVQEQLQKVKVSANAICFEIEESDALSNPDETLRFANQTRQLGCRISLCSFNHNRDSLDLLRKIKVDFIKIDGSLVWNILKDEEDLAKVIAINRIAQTIKVQTIAELVETDDIIVKLRELGIDFAQGFGVSRPKSLKVLE